jgi:hypothetical protein
LQSFYAFAPTFTGGVYVASGDVTGNGIDDIICGAGAGGGPQVTIYNGANLQLLSSFYAMAPNFTGGVRVAAGVFDNSGKAEVYTAAGPGGGPQVAVFDSSTLALLGSFFAYNPTFTGGIYIG